MSRINVANVEPAVASSKAMNDRAPTSRQNGTKVGSAIQNGHHGSCVGMGQDDFGFVKQASGGTSKMDQGLGSNDGQEMDQEWNQMFEMMERAEVSDFVANSSLKFECAPPVPLARSRATPNLIKQSKTVRNQSTLCTRPFKDTTKSYYHQSESCEAESLNHDTKYNDKSRIGISGYESELEKSRAHELGFGVNQDTSCPRAFKLHTQSFYPSNSHMKHIKENHSQSEKKVYKLGIGLREQL